MNFLSLNFIIFLTIFLIVYYVLPVKYRYILIACGNVIFYGYVDKRYVIILLFVATITYLGGYFIIRGDCPKTR